MMNVNQLIIKEISNAQQWENYILAFPAANFLQSANWAKFQSSLGKKTFNLALFEQNTEKEKLVALCLTIKETAKRGHYLTVAGGPLIDWSLANILEKLQFLMGYLKQLAQKENCLFIRFRPQVRDSQTIRNLVKQINWQPAPMHLTADLTLELNIEADENIILQQMRKNTRYEIRKAERIGITVEKSTDPKEINNFYQQQLTLAKKHHFIPFAYQFLYQQFLTFVQDNQALLFHAYQDEKEQHKKELLASAFIIFYHQEAVYHYGISTPANQRLPGSYACLWAAIKEAKTRNCRKFNFWGIAPLEQTQHRFAGVSLFKRGFGGEEVQYLPAHDLAVDWRYYLTKTFETIRKKIRHL